MRRTIALALGLLGFVGCAQVNSLGETVSSPPEDVLNALRSVLEWLGSLVGPFFVDVFNAIFG